MKKYRTKKRTRKTYRRRKLVVPRPLPGILSVKRTFYLSTWAWASTTTNDFWRYFAGSFVQLPNNAEYKALFDTYKISGIKWTFRPNINSVNPTDIAGTPAGGMGNVHYIIDPDSSFNPTGSWSSATVNSFLEMGNVKTRTMTKPFSIYVKPKISNDVTGSLTNGMPMKPPYIRTDSDSVAHNGVHILVQPSNSFLVSPTFRVTFDIFATFYMKFKGNK